MLYMSMGSVTLLIGLVLRCREEREERGGTTNMIRKERRSPPKS